MNRIFISHAAKDQPIVQSMIDVLLLGALSVNITDIFCTTTDGTKIKSGKDWRNSIKAALQKSRVTILIISPNYKESEVCISEMGAAWVSAGRVLPFIVDPINYSTVGVIQEPNQIEKLLDEKSLDRLRDLLQEELEISPTDIKSDRWTVKKMEFVEKIKKYLADNPYEPPMSRDEFEKALADNQNLRLTTRALIDEKNELQNQLEEVKKAINSDEIKAIEAKYSSTDTLGEFTSLCKIASNLLMKLRSKIRGIVFVSYSGKDLSIDYQGYEQEIDDAISRDYITNELETDWETTNLMANIRESLDAIHLFIAENSASEDFVHAYESIHDAPLSMSNIAFWEEAFGHGIQI